MAGCCHCSRWVRVHCSNQLVQQVCATRVPSRIADAPDRVRQQRNRPFEWYQDPTRRPQPTGADRSRRQVPPRQRPLTHKERVSIAIQTNAELGRLQTEAIEAAFPADGSDLEQQRQALQQLADGYQLLVTERGSCMDAINIATLLHHLSAAVTHTQGELALPTVVRWQGYVPHAAAALPFLLWHLAAEGTAVQTGILVYHGTVISQERWTSVQLQFSDTLLPQ